MYFVRTINLIRTQHFTKNKYFLPLIRERTSVYQGGTK